MADDDAAGGDRCCLLAPASGDQHRRPAFGQIEHQGQCRRTLAAGAQDVGGADIARADPADVAQTGEPGHQQTGRDRAQQVAQNHSGEQGQCRRRPSLSVPVLRDKTVEESRSKLIKALSIIYLCAI